MFLLELFNMCKDLKTQYQVRYMLYRNIYSDLKKRQHALYNYNNFISFSYREF